jgi:type IV pilus assembly protein PilM
MDFKKMITDSIGKFMKSQATTDSVVGIDIGTSSIKVVQLKRKAGVPVLETYGTLALGPYADLPVGGVTNLSAEKISLALTDLIRESGVTTSQGAVGIPSSASMVFVIDLPPAIDERRFAEVVPTEARKYIPVPVSEVSLDFWPIPKRDVSAYEVANDPTKPVAQAKTEILVAAIHNDTTQKFTDVIKASNLSPLFFEIEVFSAIRSTFGREVETVVLVDFGALKTKISVIESGIVRTLHIVNRGSADITNAIANSLVMSFVEAEEMKRAHGLLGTLSTPALSDIIKLSVDFILAETNNVILQYERAHSRTVNKIILIGGGSLLKGFYEAAAARFQIEVVKGNPFSKIQSPAFLEPVLAEIGPEFATAIGLALRQLQSD